MHSYNPHWTEYASALNSPEEFQQNIIRSFGFASDTLARLYNSILLLKEAPNDPIALIGIAQSLQETDQLEMANKFYDKALNSIPSVANESVQRQLKAYIFFRQGFSASAQQRIEDAIKFWESAKKLDVTYVELVDEWLVSIRDVKLVDVQRSLK